LIEEQVLEIGHLKNINEDGAIILKVNFMEMGGNDGELD
jgi:hypothetical protein